MDIVFKFGTEELNVHLPTPKLQWVMKDIRAVLKDLRHCPGPIDAASRLCIRLFQANQDLHVGLMRMDVHAPCAHIDLRNSEIEFTFSSLPPDKWAFDEFSDLSDQDLKRLSTKCLAASN